MSDPYMHKVERSAVITVIGVILLFLTSIITILIAPRFMDASWTSPSSPYQSQMYEVEDPNIYLSSAATNGVDLQYVRHLKQDYTLIAYKESDDVRIVTSPALEKYVTKLGDKELKLSSKLLLLRKPEGAFVEKGQQIRLQLQNERAAAGKLTPSQTLDKIDYQFMELYDPQVKEIFALDPLGGIIQNWVDKDYHIIDETLHQIYHHDQGVIYAQNPVEFRISPIRVGSEERWHYDPAGQPLKGLDELISPKLGFHSRKELISMGEHIYAIEGCWYCHTDQTRTLIQDTVLNGSDSFPAPPSSPNEYIYQKITFPGTRRIGPDLSRVGIKRPSRDWHKSHFWAPKTASEGSIMPAFRHFFDNDPRGTNKSVVGIPNHEFESIFQYMMTKGTRITPPTKAWWLGKDPVQTKEIISGRQPIK